MSDFKCIIRSEANVNQPSQSANTESSSGTGAETSQEYVTDRVIRHRINDDQEHPSAKIREVVHRVQWHGLKHSVDNFKRTHHIPRNNIVSSY